MNLYNYTKEVIDDKIKINIKVNQKDLYFLFDSKYDEYIYESYDGFVIGLLIYAMFNKKSINVDGSMSEKLYKNLIQNIIPLLHFAYPQLHIIRLTANSLVADHYQSKETGFGLSCGIDSLCCLEDLYYKEENEGLKLSFACNFHSGGSNNLEQYRLRLNHVQKFIENNTKLQLLSVESNINEFNVPSFTHEKIHAIKTISFILLFQKLFKRFYLASGMTFNEYKLIPNPTTFGWLEGFLVPLLSTESTEICLHGSNYTRLYKTYLISKNTIYDTYIDVCINSNKNNLFVNCGTCFKCLRTLLTLECYTDIRRYSKIFDLYNYLKQRNPYIKTLNPKKYPLDEQLLQLLKMNKKI